MQKNLKKEYIYRDICIYICVCMYSYVAKMLSMTCHIIKFVWIIFPPHEIHFYNVKDLDDRGGLLCI